MFRTMRKGTWSRVWSCPGKILGRGLVPPVPHSNDSIAFATGFQIINVASFSCRFFK